MFKRIIVVALASAGLAAGVLAAPAQAVYHDMTPTPVVHDLAPGSVIHDM